MNNRNSHLFSRIPAPQIQRSVFDRSHTYKSTFDAGYLVPFYCDEVLPGDSFKIKSTTFARLNTPIVPIMDNLYLDTFFFYVPTRLLWKHFKNFMGEQAKPDDSIDYVVPVFEDDTVFSELSLGDYFGLPVGKKTSDVNCLPFRAYNLIWNEWFRDENLQDSVPFDDGDGDDDVDDYKLLKRGKRHDYFTSALPWPQKGDAVDLPLNDTTQHLPVILGGANATNNHVALGGSGLCSMPPTAYPNNITYFGDAVVHNGIIDFPSGQQFRTDFESIGTLDEPTPEMPTTRSPRVFPLYAQLTALGSVTINSLRQAFQLQKFLEACSRGGTRYTELIRSHFGVISPDARLQRPEYLGGRSTRININPVVQTSSTDATSPQGNLSAFGVVGADTNVMSRSFTEHGYIIGLVSVRADLTYQQGLNRMWSRKTRYDFYWPTFAHLGEQAVLNKEIYYQDDDTKHDVNEAVFGYQERYAEYRFFPNQITGRFRSTASQPLDSWHLAQKFDSLPTLGPDFIQENPPMDRVVSVPSEPDILFDSFVQVKAARPMPLYGVPGLVDHF